MSRDDDPPELRPPGKRRPDSLWGDTQRAKIGADHRKNDGTSSESRRSQLQRRSAVVAIPEPVGIPDSGEFEAQSTDEVTSPIDLLNAEPDEVDREAVRQSRRDSGSHVTAEDLAKFARHINKHILQLKADERSANTERANQLLELLNRPPDEHSRKLEARVKTLEGRSKLLIGALVVVFGGGGGTGIALLQRLWDRAEREGVMANQILHLTEEVDRLRDHPYLPAAERPSWPQPPTKEAKP